MKIRRIVLLFCFLAVSMTGAAMALPDGFVYLKDVKPSIIQDVKYVTRNNFLGRPVKGYEAPVCILTRQTAEALSHLQDILQAQSLGLKVYDCYRPQMAVDDFIAWSADANDQKMKKKYYPRVNKADFFELGYIGKKSGHTRGSTVDLTLVRFSSDHHPIDLGMGTHFDYMDEKSHAFSTSVPRVAQKNRLLLRQYMDEVGFAPIAEEWWHFTLKNEPYPTTYFNFPVE